MNMKSCNRRGKVGNPPSKEEFCIAYRGQKLAEQYKCPLMQYHKKYLKENDDVGMEAKEILEKNIKHLEKMGDGGRSTCGMSKGGMMGDEVPVIWRKHMGNIVKGEFCSLDGEWYWHKVATCGCKNCGGMKDDWMEDKWMDDMMKDFEDEDGMMGKDAMPEIFEDDFIN